MSVHLAEISGVVALVAQAILVLGGAGWHGSVVSVMATNVTLLPLRGSKHDPVESLWAFLRKNWLRLQASVKYRYLGGLLPGLEPLPGPARGRRLRHRLCLDRGRCLGLLVERDGALVTGTLLACFGSTFTDQGLARRATGRVRLTKIIRFMVRRGRQSLLRTACDPGLLDSAGTVRARHIVLS